MAMDNRLLVPRYKYDPDAARYLAAVEAADGQALETPVRRAINAFVAALKADNLWDAMGSSCLLCGPRTLAGALVPLRGDAPTAYGFVDGDFDRLGLTGDGTSYLDSNRAANDDPQNDCHGAVYAFTQSAAVTSLIGGIQTVPSVFRSFEIDGSQTTNIIALRSASSFDQNSGTFGEGLFGASRSSSGAFIAYRDGSSETVSTASEAGVPNNIYVFALNRNDIPEFHTTSKLAFYSLGTSLDLPKLDSHISSYVTAIGAAL